MIRYEDLEPTMDAEVDNRLGDSISYSRAGAAPQIIRGFLNLEADIPTIEGIDPIRRRWTCKIAVTRLPGGPKPGDRITHKKLGNVVYKPSANTISDDGKSWVFNLQKA